MVKGLEKAVEILIANTASGKGSEKEIVRAVLAEIEDWPKWYFGEVGSARARASSYVKLHGAIKEYVTEYIAELKNFGDPEGLLNGVYPRVDDAAMGVLTHVVNWPEWYWKQKELDDLSGYWESMDMDRDIYENSDYGDEEDDIGGVYDGLDAPV